ncbi:hypothetical protein HNP46_001409 [Pseudomonas nitritireducens]|uniref:Uncharacterized protein n=1 Tax=Pseudomonas nitroreducens TaxID=46680 RepID=A0A7W7P0N6_PSENT|nr:hypothetical protein [Pseudomonas nitritireducens]
MHVPTHVEYVRHIVLDIAEAGFTFVFQSPLAHESAVADSRHHQSQALQLGIGAADGTAGDAQLVGEKAVRQQLSPSGNHAIDNVLFQCARQSLVFNAGRVCERIFQN